MKDWAFAQTHASQQLAEVHMFSITKVQPGIEVEFFITVKEYVTPKEPTMHFFAQADKLTNQKTAPYRPTGWGKTMLEALSECVKAIDRFPFEGMEGDMTRV
ncbi:MAG TPA: hypothetical protein VHW09_23320 [Bryobacteraceae bacterium]|jgi:hypothetical protein|nr:hypothetical protein [Bryobacteraceae bacterium]